MGIVIHVNFPQKYTLKKARKFLGSRFFREALMVWTLDYLERTSNAGEAWLTGAADAYGAILRYRMQRNDSSSHVAQVIDLKRAA